MFRCATLILTLAAGFSQAYADDSKTLCTLVADADGTVLMEQGPACGERVTPASTFKVALAVMGFDAGFLKGPHEPVLPFKEGYADWGGAEWRKPIDPSSWMTNSVVWYSQQIAHQLGAKRLTAYAKAFVYGNADLSGDPGKDNGLDRSWIGSSLTISPREQIAFVAKLAAARLPVSQTALVNARDILDSHQVAGWTLHGKTGSAFPRNRAGQLDRSRGWGWYVGWAEKDGRRLVFARLRQDTKREKAPGGIRTRGTFFEDWTALISERSIQGALK